MRPLLTLLQFIGLNLGAFVALIATPLFGVASWVGVAIAILLVSIGTYITMPVPRLPDLAYNT